MNYNGEQAKQAIDVHGMINWNNYVVKTSSGLAH